MRENLTITEQLFMLRAAIDVVHGKIDRLREEIHNLRMEQHHGREQQQPIQTSRDDASGA